MKRPDHQAVYYMEHRRLGRISFDDAFRFQEEAIQRLRLSERYCPVIFSLEHEPVITCGRSTQPSSLLLTTDEYEQMGIAVRTIDRGGDVTYHGPGQVVVYPIICLRRHNLRVGEYVRVLEKSMIQTCAGYGVRAFSRGGFPGCWTEKGKIGAIGAAVKSGGITKHGIAFNVSANLDHFRTIVPCGIANFPVVGLCDLVDVPVTFEEVEERLVGELFEILINKESPDEQLSR